MQVFKIYPVGFAANSYLLTADGKSAVCVDPAQPRVLDEARRRGLEIKFVLLTHGHFDHVGGCAALQRAGAKIGCSNAEKQLVLAGDGLAERFGCVPVQPFSIDFTVKDGETPLLCGIRFLVIETPGHTAGGVCYLAEDSLFTGDTLFCGSVGRCDLPTGDGAALEKSVKKLYALRGDYTVYPGHEEDTTLEAERKNNLWIRDDK